MKIDRKATVLGSLLGLLLGALVVYAQTINLQFQGGIYIPEDLAITVSGTTKLGDTHYLPTFVLYRNETSTTITLSNSGSKNAQLSYTAETTDPNLEIDLEAYIAHSTIGDAWAESPTFTLPRGSSADIRIKLTDNGATAGNYGFTVTITATP